LNEINPDTGPTASPLYNIAHRGARSLAPENTMAAIKKACEIGAHGVEVDVAATADGALILFHDDLLTRTTDIHLRFPERQKNPFTTFSLQEIQSLDAGSWFIETDPFGEIGRGNISVAELREIRGIRVPILEEVLHFVKEHSFYINLELKALPQPLEHFPMVEKLLDVIESVDMPANRLAVSSFNFDYLRKIKKTRADIEVNALIGFPDSGVQDWGNFEFEVYNANAEYTDEKQIQKALSKGCRVNLFTVNDPRDMKRFLDAGVSMLITDFPKQLKYLETNL
jgi:glycerophosphoryl diester phosphodiesterase